jgi:hypothetical protein
MDRLRLISNNNNNNNTSPESPGLIDGGRGIPALLAHTIEAAHRDMFRNDDSYNNPANRNKYNDNDNDDDTPIGGDGLSRKKFVLYGIGVLMAIGVAVTILVLACK